LEQLPGNVKLPESYIDHVDYLLGHFYNDISEDISKKVLLNGLSMLYPRGMGRVEGEIAAVETRSTRRVETRVRVHDSNEGLFLQIKMHGQITYGEFILAEKTDPLTSRRYLCTTILSLSLNDAAPCPCLT
jgi:hypothetical protein